MDTLRSGNKLVLKNGNPVLAGVYFLDLDSSISRLWEFNNGSFVDPIAPSTMTTKTARGSISTGEGTGVRGGDCVYYHDFYGVEYGWENADGPGMSCSIVEIDGLNEFSFSMWFRYDYYGIYPYLGYRQELFRCQGFIDSPAGNWPIFGANITEAGDLYMTRMNGLDFSYNHFVVEVSAGPYMDGNWHQIAYTHKNGINKCFLDGGLVGYKDTKVSLNRFTVHFGFNGQDDNNKPFRGSLDQIRFYKRALNNGEIGMIYNFDGR